MLKQLAMAYMFFCYLLVFLIMLALAAEIFAHIALAIEDLRARRRRRKWIEEYKRRYQSCVHLPKEKP